jgi:hypothetical protein
MAKRRRAAALFEVIHTDKRFPARHENGLFQRSWWAFGRGGGESDAAAPVDVGPIERAPMERAPMERAPMERAPMERAPMESSAPRGPSLLSRLFNLLPSSPRVGLQLDPERQIVQFQMSYTGALVAAFTLLVALSLAYVIGKHTSRRIVPALAEATTEELRAGPAQPDVLDVGNGEPPAAMASTVVPAAAPTGKTAAPAPGTGAQATAARPSQWTEPKAPATARILDGKRIAGMHYVIVQTYPAQERQLAEDAVKMLNENGILCRIETDVPYAPRWLCVVGVDGFDRIRSSPEYDAYVAKIQQISDKFGGTSKFKKFEPKPYKWKDAKAQ